MDYNKYKMKKIPFDNFITKFKQLTIKYKKTVEQQVKRLTSIINQATITTPPILDIFSDLMQLDARPPSRYTREQCIELSLYLYYKKPGYIKSNCKEKQANNAKYNTNVNTNANAKYAPHINRFSIVNQYQNSGPYRNIAISLYQNSFSSTNHFSVILLYYTFPTPSSLAQEIDLGGYIEGSIYSKESESSIPQPGILKD
ncbi:putative retrotransposon nucleocapsid protein [Botrytis fragariae]|uniref:Putative retrotransposon nucleocapsid protein n=1 Tax=Botrytis fragariae TaxID=1964551 RepID=A0A8H6ANN8_9HELO|nr:putative retrotransposon nucleocapsid protein [Botrytis fragariae]KAF5870694.1 putative retrotransposon nucleocapsid protein [Botrytis fragariae]